MGLTGHTARIEKNIFNTLREDKTLINDLRGKAKTLESLGAIIEKLQPTSLAWRLQSQF